MDGGNGDVDSAGRVVVRTTSRACDRQIVFILAEDVGAEDGHVDVVHGDLAHLWEVDGHLSGLQMEEACLVDNCAKIGGQECGQSHNLELCSPNIRCDLSKVILLIDVI